jgi:O-antigen/teichoic acid export membrane protein
MWSASTDAYARGDIAWIRKAMKTINKIQLAACGCLIIMILISNFVYKIWVGSEIEIPLDLSIMMALYIAIVNYSRSYSCFLNGLGKLRLQTINTLVVAILFYPLCSFLGNRLGIIGVVSGLCCLYLSGLVINKIQFDKVLKGSAKGMWNR